MNQEHQSSRLLTEIVKKHDKHVAKVLQKRDIVGSMIRDCTSFDELSALCIDVEKLSPRLVDNMPKQHDTEVKGRTFAYRLRSNAHSALGSRRM
jgi:hypothetical protein